jgi:adenosylcobinamide kinase/adenosylcobinamide-phosphate guanylyltransferase
MAVTFILGGARSGKSAYAQRLAEEVAADSRRPPLLIATAEALDAEMAERIARHRAERGAAWRTLEEPTDLAGALHALAVDDVAVVDCLTLWLSNLLHREIDLEVATQALADALTRSAAEVILVANEVGLGIVPENALARRFRDAAGRLNQAVAARADRMVVMFAGQALLLKASSRPS